MLLLILVDLGFGSQKPVATGFGSMAGFGSAVKASSPLAGAAGSYKSSMTGTGFGVASPAFTKPAAVMSTPVVLLYFLYICMFHP